MVFDVRKNSERKRFKALELRVSISLESLRPPALVVSLPISAYKSASIEDPALLQSWLKKCDLLPPGWTFADNQTSSLVSVQLYKLPQFASEAGVVYIVEINQTMSWKLKFGESVIRPDIEMLSGFLPTIGNINQLHSRSRPLCHYTLEHSRSRPLCHSHTWTL